MTLADFLLYGEQIARRNKLIGHTDTEQHFVQFGLEAVHSALKDVMYPLLGAELPVTGFDDRGSDNIHIINDGAFVIVQSVREGDSEAVNKAYNEMHIIAIQIVQKFLNDRKLSLVPGRPSPQNQINNLAISRIKIVDVGPIFENCYGWRVSFPMQGATDMDLVESDWIDEVAFSG